MTKSNEFKNNFIIVTSYALMMLGRAQQLALICKHEEDKEAPFKEVILDECSAIIRGFMFFENENFSTKNALNDMAVDALEKHGVDAKRLIGLNVHIEPIYADDDRKEEKEVDK